MNIPVFSNLVSKGYYQWQKVECNLYRTLGRNHKCACGHTAKRKTVITVHDVQHVYILNKKREYCPQCWKKAVIKCAWCGKTIFPGDPITLCAPTDEDCEFYPHAVIYKTTPCLQVVGCLSSHCCNVFADRSGFWIMPGKVQRIISPIEMALGLLNDYEYRSIFIGDLADPKNIMPVAETVPASTF